MWYWEAVAIAGRISLLLLRSQIRELLSLWVWISCKLLFVVARVAISIMKHESCISRDVEHRFLLFLTKALKELEDSSTSDSS